MRSASVIWRRRSMSAFSRAAFSRIYSKKGMKERSTVRGEGRERHTGGGRE